MGKSNEQILCKLSNGEILRLYLIVHVAMETTKTSNVTCQSNTFISIFFTCQVSACELQPFSCNNLANDLYSETGKTVFSHLKGCLYRIYSINCPGHLLNFWTLRVGAYSRWALIRGWALIKFSPFSASEVCLFCNKTISANNKT